MVNPVRSVRNHILKVLRGWALSLGMNRARGELSRGAIGSSTLRLLHFGWGNRGWSADPAYLGHVLQLASRAERPILECGSGLSTLLLALTGQRTGTRIIALEHDPRWRERVARALAACDLSEAVELPQASLTSRGDYSWYEVDPGILPPHFDVVVCDGPPGNTPGGRYGLLPALGDRLDSRSRILMDDAHRPGEQAVLERWKNEFGIRSEPLTGGKYALVRKDSSISG